MAFDINWGMAQSPNYLNNALAAFQQGMGMGREMAREKAVAAYVANPDDANALAGIAKYEPRLALQHREQQQQREQQAQMVDLTKRAASGDTAALTELAGRNPDLWMKLDDRTKDQVKRATSFMGQAAMAISQIPEEQRAAAWAQYVQQAESTGMDIPTHYETYTRQALNGVIAEVGAMEKLIKQGEPDWRFSPNGGLVDFNNPQSIQQYGDWMRGQGPGQTATPPPPPGFVVDGQGGPTPSASGSFRP